MKVFVYILFILVVLSVVFVFLVGEVSVKKWLQIRKIHVLGENIREKIRDSKYSKKEE